MYLACRNFLFVPWAIPPSLKIPAFCTSIDFGLTPTIIGTGLPPKVPVMFVPLSDTFPEPISFGVPERMLSPVPSASVVVHPGVNALILMRSQPTDSTSWKANQSVIWILRLPTVASHRVPIPPFFRFQCGARFLYSAMFLNGRYPPAQWSGRLPLLSMMQDGSSVFGAAALFRTPVANRSFPKANASRVRPKPMAHGCAEFPKPSGV